MALVTHAEQVKINKIICRKFLMRRIENKPLKEHVIIEGEGHGKSISPTICDRAG